MAQAAWWPCSCPAPVVSVRILVFIFRLALSPRLGIQLSHLFREVAHRKKVVSPKKKYPRYFLAAIRRRPYLDGCLLEAKLAWLRQSGFLGVNTVGIHPCALAVVHYGLCFPSSRLLHAMALVPSSSSTSSAFPRRVITHKYRGSQQFLRVEYSSQIHRFDTRGAKKYLKVLAAELSIQPHQEINYLQQSDQ
ncbi:hypothetical protein ACQJBY_059323 [Aegilops geniculata]